MYDFDAGDLSLNFANTEDWHASKEPLENLKSYTDLVDWGVKAGLVSSDLADRLRQFAIDMPDDANQSYQQAIHFRETLYRIFVHHAARLPIPEADLVLLNDMACQAMGRLKLTFDGKAFQWKFPADFQGVNLILWPIARAATDLLTSNQAAHIRKCEDDRGCGYLFIDQTKNHSRRWCSMESCGNRAKARRHYSRLQTN
jgi:predicted RNA-binding Zn ribbon-like protein